MKYWKRFTPDRRYICKFHHGDAGGGYAWRIELQAGHAYRTWGWASYDKKETT